MVKGKEGVPSEGPVGRDDEKNREGDRGHDGFTNGRSTVDELIIQVLGGRASPFDEGRLKRWRAAAAENEEYFLEMARVWDLTTPEVTSPASAPPPIQDILDAASGHGSSETISGEKKAGSHLGPWIRWGLLAASVAAVGLGVQLFRAAGPEPLMVYQAPEGEIRTVALADGSFARLAEGSVLREWDMDGRREVSLDGRAFFAVARDENRPFVARTRAGTVQVLGTRFQVDTEGDAVETVVVEGLVEMANDHGSVQVPAGTVARMAGDRAPTTRQVDDVFALLDWPEGVLIFQGTPLGEVAAEVSRYFSRPIRIESPQLSQRRVTAWFQGEAFEALVESLCVVTEAICRPSDGGFVMESGGGGGDS